MTCAFINVLNSLRQISPIENVKSFPRCETRGSYFEHPYYAIGFHCRIVSGSSKYSIFLSFPQALREFRARDLQVALICAEMLWRYCRVSRIRQHFLPHTETDPQ
jgi:hypothetical protein